MIVVVPYTNLRAEVVEALAGWDYSLVDVSDSDESYWSLWATLWAEQETFCIVEHDVVVRPDTLTELAECPEPWCAFGVPYIHGVNVGLGCAKFTTEVMRARPSALADVGEMEAQRHPKRHWCSIDSFLHLVLADQYQHVHGPPLVHLSDKRPAHGCYVEAQ